MSLFTKVSKEIPAPKERRGCSREILKHYSVLVFFGESNWGKIIDISESGMSFEFAAAPALRERINLTLQTMACMPVPQTEGIFAHTFETLGEIVWTREFERIAGVRFLHFGEGCREQIREWVAFEKSAAITEVNEESEEKATAGEEALPLTPTPSDTFQASNAEIFPETGVTPESVPQNLGERELGFAREEDETLAFDTFSTPADEQQQKRDTERDSKSSRASLAASGILAVLAVALGVRMIMTSAGRRTDAAEGIADSGAEPAKSPTIAHPSSADRTLPFQVEVLDMSGKRWLLRFTPDTSKNEAASEVSDGEAKPQEQKQVAAFEKPGAADKFAFVAPKAGLTGTDHLTAKTSPGEAPPISNTLATPQGEMMGALAAGSATPAPPVQPAVGGEVHQARLIRSFPPAYPELARTTRVSGDVVVDALIDVTGKVTSVKVVSGPVLLQQAAMETVRQWKYEAARLDGKPIATHLSVTVRFRLN